MNRVSSFNRIGRSGIPESESGYTLMGVLLLIAVMTISLSVALPRVIQEIRRDKELEALHRGQQYTRAIRSFYRRTGNYPIDLAQLESFNNIRFLRKRYTDPLTGGEWKLVHQGEVKPEILSQGWGFFGGSYTSRSPHTADMASNGIIPGIAGAGPVATNSYGGNGGVTQVMDPLTGKIQNSAGDSQSPSGSEGSTATTTFGGPKGNRRIVGVSSTSLGKSIRVYKKQTHYNDWQFIYDPASDGITGGGQVGPNSPGPRSDAAGASQSTPLPPDVSSQPAAPSPPTAP